MNEKKLINDLRKNLRVALNNEIKVIEYYKKAILDVIELASINSITKKNLVENLNKVFSKMNLSDNYIKKIRGMITNFFEGSRKYPSKIDIIKIRLENINSINELVELSRNFKKSGDTEKSQKESKAKAKSKEVEIKINPKSNSIDRPKYYKIIKAILKISDDKLDALDDDKIVALFDKILEINELIRGIEG